MDERYSYVLVTAAHNEAAFIGQTIESILAQSFRPSKWIIVDDGSVDETAAIVSRYAGHVRWIELLRITEAHAHNFGAQALAINRGIRRLSGLSYSFIGNLDADITADCSYFEQLLRKFAARPALGLAGGCIHEKASNGQFKSRRTNSPHSVAHACQLFRRSCFESVGGAYLPLPYGGPDTYAEISARMNGWEVEAFPDLSVLHHRPTASVGGILRSSFRQGRMDYSLGMLPSFELLRLTRRLWTRPRLIAAVVRLGGFTYSYCRRERKCVPETFLQYSRAEQHQRIASLFQILS